MKRSLFLAAILLPMVACVPGHSKSGSYDSDSTIGLVDATTSQIDATTSQAKDSPIDASARDASRDASTKDAATGHKLASVYPYAFPVGPAGGSLAGTYPNPTIAPGAVPMAGDVTGTNGATVVVRVNGATVPAAGGLTTGNAAFVSGPSALTYSALNLAGGSGWVVGQLPVANLANGVAAQILVTNAGATSPVWVTSSGDAINSATGVWTVQKINGTSVPAGGALTTGNGLFVSGVSSLSYSALNLAGGAGWVTGILPSANGGTNNGFFAVAGPAASTKTFTFPNASANVLTDNATITVPQGGTGDTTLTAHGVLLGEGTSPIAATTPGTAGQLLIGQGAAADPSFQTVTGDETISAAGVVVNTKINGTTVPAGGALTTGNACFVSGVSACTYSALNLAGGAGWVTGVLPAANQAAQTMAGDVTGTTAASVVSAISGVSPIVITPANLQFTAATVSPTISQVTQTSDVATNSTFINPQAPFALATSTRAIPGGLVVTLGAPTNGQTTEGLIEFRRVGGVNTDFMKFRYATNAGTSTAAGGVIVDGNNSNAIGLNGDTNITSGGFVRLMQGGFGNSVFAIGNSNDALFDLGSGADLNQMRAGGTGIIGIHQAAANPNSSPSDNHSGELFADATDVALKWRAPGTGGQLQTTLAPTHSGTVNSQALIKDEKTGILRTVSTNTATTIVSYLFATGTSAHVDVTTVCRAVTAPAAGSIGDTWTGRRSFAVRDVAGTLTVVGSLTSIDTNTDTSMSTTTVSTNISAQTLQWQVANVATATVDCTADLNVLIN